MNELKDKILEANSAMISCFLRGKHRDMDLYRIYLNSLIDEALQLKRNVYDSEPNNK